MKTVSFKLGGVATPGDVVSLSYSAKRGGKTSASHLVREGETLDAVAQDLTFAVETHWCQPLFKAIKGANNDITVICADGADDVSFSWQIEHVVGANHLSLAPGGNLTVEILE